MRRLFYEDFFLIICLIQGRAMDWLGFSSTKIMIFGEIKCRNEIFGWLKTLNLYQICHFDKSSSLLESNIYFIRSYDIGCLRTTYCFEKIDIIFSVLNLRFPGQGIYKSQCLETCRQYLFSTLPSRNDFPLMKDFLVQQKINQERNQAVQFHHELPWDFHLDISYDFETMDFGF